MSNEIVANGGNRHSMQKEVRVSTACRVIDLIMKSFVVTLKLRDVINILCFFISLVILED